MAEQYVFKKGYIEYLRTHIRVEDYLLEEFPYDRTQVLKLYKIMHPEGLLEKLNPDSSHDIDTAIAIYEAYPNLPLHFAQQDDLWVYLTHVDLFPYVKKRWSLDSVLASKDKEKINNHIINHWHHNLTNFLRTTFAGLWWNVYLTRLDDREDPYELTKIMYDCGQDWRIMRFGELSLVRSKESMIGVLEFLRDNPDVYKTHFDARGQFISRYFNLLGGSQQLSAMDRYFFKDKLESLKDRIIEITSVDDIHNKIITL